EYTFMAPLARSVHLLGMGLFAVAYGVVRSAALFAVLAFAFRLAIPSANFVGALVVAAVASVSFIGVGMMTAVLPLISPEKGMQLGFMTQGLLLAVSGVYYDVSVLPAPLRAVARFSPATYTLDGIRSSIIAGTGVGGLWHDLWPLMVIGGVSIPLGLWVFHQGEVHAKRHGKLKRSG
ncbi:MAG TPA: ABC transporter permease, partial [Acidimicrobiales bacterium]|nr:ABC transporter permease [Acidimicrobiales bacterium]